MDAFCRTFLFMDSLQKHTLRLRMKKNILLIANSEWYLLNFRKDLLERLYEQKFNVILFYPYDKEPNQHLQKSFTIHRSPLQRGKLSLRNLFSFLHIFKKIISKEKPDLINAFGLQASVLLAISNFFFRVPCILSITGLGYTFLSNQFLAISIRKFLRLSSKFFFRRKYVSFIFQNNEDLKIFNEYGLILNRNAYLIFGSGVDTSFFYPNTKKEKKHYLNFLFSARLIKDKGINETLTAFKKIRDQYHETVLTITGDIDDLNPSSLSSSELDRLKAIKGVRYLGHVKNIKEIYDSVDIVVLPSYREGLSRVLIEAASCGLPIITSNAPGCRDVVEDNKNGFLVEAGSAHEIYVAMQKFHDNPSLISNFGKFSREIAISKFSSAKINQETITVYNHLLQL